MARKATRRSDLERGRVLAELEASGQTVASFARQRGLSAWTLYEWRRRLQAKGRAAKALAPAFVPLHVKPEPTSAVAFQVELDSGTRIHVPGGFDEAELRRLVEVLSSC